MNFEIKDFDTFSEVIVKGNILSIYDSKPMMDAVNQKISSGHKRIALNLEKTAFLNSEGLNVLLKILTSCRNSGGEAVIFSTNQELNKLFIITKLESIFNVLGSRKEVEEYFQKAGAETKN